MSDAKVINQLLKIQEERAKMLSGGSRPKPGVHHSKKFLETHPRFQAPHEMHGSALVGGVATAWSHFLHKQRAALDADIKRLEHMGLTPVAARQQGVRDESELYHEMHGAGSVGGSYHRKTDRPLNPWQQFVHENLHNATMEQHAKGLSGHAASNEALRMLGHEWEALKTGQMHGAALVGGRRPRKH